MTSREFFNAIINRLIVSYQRHPDKARLAVTRWAASIRDMGHLYELDYVLWAGIIQRQRGLWVNGTRRK